MREIPLYRKDGSIRAYAVVDDEDYERLNAHRWYLSTKGHYAVRSKREGGRGTPLRTIRMHREVLGLQPGDGLETDHVDRTQKLDNRRSNLRPATTAQNRQNLSAAGYQGSVSRFRGVGLDKRDGRWSATVTVNGIVHGFGRYATEEEAGRAAAEGRRQLMPFSEEARCNG